jgi:hypothetical protein
MIDAVECPVEYLHELAAECVMAAHQSYDMDAAWSALVGTVIVRRLSMMERARVPQEIASQRHSTSPLHSDQRLRRPTHCPADAAVVEREPRARGRVSTPAFCTVRTGRPFDGTC